MEVPPASPSSTSGAILPQTTSDSDPKSPLFCFTILPQNSLPGASPSQTCALKPLYLSVGFLLLYSHSWKCQED